MAGLVPLSEFDVASFLEESELPANERIIVRIQVGSDERPTVIHMNSELLDAFSSQRREIFGPESGVSEGRDLFR